MQLRVLEMRGFFPGVYLENCRHATTVILMQANGKFFISIFFYNNMIYNGNVTIATLVFSQLVIS